MLQLRSMCSILRVAKVSIRGRLDTNDLQSISSLFRPVYNFDDELITKHYKRMLALLTHFALCIRSVVHNREPGQGEEYILITS